MSKTITVKSYVSETKLELSKILESNHSWELVKKEPSFLLYQTQKEGYIYIKDYGGIVYFNLDSKFQYETNKKLCDTTQSTLSPYTEEYLIKIDPSHNNQMRFDTLELKELNLDIVHIICLNLSQSTALYNYQNLADQLLSKTKIYTHEMADKGKVSLNRKKLMKFIGEVLNIKNKISEHLYIFNTPMVAWNEEQSFKIDSVIKEDLEIHYRYNAIREQLDIVKENLDHFKDINLHDHSSTLEWIIILLILFEIIQVMMEKALS